MVANGHVVWGVARSGNELEKLQNELGAEWLRYSVTDLTKYDQIESLLVELGSAKFFPELVYLNAGLYSTTDSTFQSVEHAEQLLLTNLHAPIWLYNGFMRSIKPPKSVILVSSLFALLTDPVNPTYAASKAGVSAAFKAFALNDQAPHIQIVHLGPVNTHVNEHAEQKSSSLLAAPEAVAKYLAKLYKRGGTEFIHPFTAWAFYQVFRFLPLSVFKWVMMKVRR